MNPTLAQGSPPAPADSDFSIRHPCGHCHPFETSCLSTDQFLCPTCGLRWSMRQDPPIRRPSGWVEPGRRHLQIHPQLHLPIS
jgi:hypothetical protein